MNYQLSFQTKQAQYIGLISTTLRIIAWICALWLWASVLEATPDAIDMGIIALTIVPAIYLFWKQPEYGIIALMFYTSGFIAPSFVDVRLPVIGGGLEMRDILLILMFVLTFFKRLSHKQITIPWWPVGGILLAFMLMMFFSLIYALFYESVPSNWALSDARILFFYSMFFITAWSITSKQSLYILVIASFVIADITATIVLIQQYLGPYNYLLNAMNDSSWQIWEVAGSTRVVPPGIVYMYFMMLISLGLTIFWHVDLKKTLFWIFHTCFLSIGLIFTFTRSAWVASAIAIALLVIFTYPSYKHYFLRILVLIGAVAAVIFALYSLVFPNLSLENKAALGVFDRFVTIFTVEDTLETNSLQWRYFEIQEANKAILEAPLTGVGLGNSYRNINAFQREAQGAWTDELIYAERIDRFTRYVHSSYFAIAVKMGIPALLVLLSFYSAAILKSFALHQILPDSLAKGLALTIATGLIGLLQWSFLHAQLFLTSSTAVIGLMIGILASIHYLYVSYPQNYTIF
jgi:O-antigen ligase